MKVRYAAATALFAASVTAGTASGHADGVDGAAWTACESAALADACEYTDHHDAVYRGSCRLMSDELPCVRSEPIERPDARSGVLPEAPGS